MIANDIKYLESRGAKMSSSPRLAQIEYSKMAVPVWSFPLDTTLVRLTSITSSFLSNTSTMMFSDNLVGSWSKLGRMWISPVRRYFFPVRLIGCRNIKYINFYEKFACSKLQKGNIKLKYQNSGGKKHHTDDFSVSNFTDMFPKKMHELTKWSSCCPADSKHIFCDPLCDSRNKESGRLFNTSMYNSMHA